MEPKPPTPNQKLAAVVRKVGAKTVWEALLYEANPQNFVPPEKSLELEDAVIGVEEGFYNLDGSVNSHCAIAPGEVT